MITRNEAANIAEALESLAWADEIVVVYSGSTDTTLEICRRHTDRILHRDWTGFVDQKNYAVQQAAFDWIFSLDADERVSPPLRQEIEELRSSNPAHHGYRIPRVASFMGRWIRHGDWYPDFQLRLFDRRHGRWQGGRVHESVGIDGEPGYLKGKIHHFTYRSLSDYLRRLETYSSLAAADYSERGKRSTPARMLLNPTVTFLKAYFLKRGFLDGAPGLIVAVMGAVSVFFKYAKLYELQSSPQPGSRYAGARG
ncbi:MAG: glycosyltransferase family 2 protein [Acidobacteria bacterium]|nr:glycosyltransferase family 2 protein [Acidobacteriota bacterium]